MGRCVATGDAIAKACGIAAEVCDDLNDINYGLWQFKTFVQAKNEDAKLFATRRAAPQPRPAFPAGNQLQDLAARVANALRLVLARHPDDAIVLVGHDSVNRALLLELLGLPLADYWRLGQEPCCLNEIDVTDGKVCVQRLN